MVLNYWQIIGLIFFGFYLFIEGFIFSILIEFGNKRNQESKNKINQEKNGSDNL